jgi:hypothetical protein
MPTKKSSTTKSQPIAQRRPRTRKKPVLEPQPDPTEPQPLAPTHRSSPWLAPVVIVLAISLLGWLVLENQPPLYMVAAERRLAQMEAMLQAKVESGGLAEANLAAADKRARACHEGLQSMVRMWNRYARELRAARSGSAAKFNAARRRFENAQKQASNAVRRCEAA